VTGGKPRAAVLTEISLILAAVFWGSNYAATKFAALSMPPVSIVAVRFAVAGLLMYGVLRVLEPESRLARKDLLSMAGLGCLGVAIGQTTFTFGVSMTSAANTGFIFATAPVWGLLFGFVLGLERPTWRGTSGVGLSIIGVGVIFYEGLGLEGANLIGDLLVLLAAMGFGAYTVLSMRLLGGTRPWPLPPTRSCSAVPSSC
jgi:drug/metabolite transporter (DMT)-like permease